jgi:hypothetical protein
MKCIVCVEQAFLKEPPSEKNTVQDAIDNARTAVTVRDGEALCVPHLYELMLLNRKR